MLYTNVQDLIDILSDVLIMCNEGYIGDRQPEPPVEYQRVVWLQPHCQHLPCSKRLNNCEHPHAAAYIHIDV